MLNKILLGTLLITTSGIANAGFVFNNDITGADMAGIEVTVDFTDGGYESTFWSVLSTDLGTTGNDIIDHQGFSGGVSGTGWSLSQSGYTLGNIGPDNTIYGMWNFEDDTNTINKITINTGDTGILFDTKTLTNLSEDTNGSGQGRAFDTGTPSEVTATYSDPVFQELSKTLTIELTTAGTEIQFLADTDLREEDDGNSEIVLVENEVVSVANEEVLNDTLANAASAAGLLEGGLVEGMSEVDAQAAIDSAAVSGNKVAIAIQGNPDLVAAVAADPSILTAATSIDITDLPAIIETPNPEQDLANQRNAQILEIVEDIVAQEIRSGESGSTISGNGDINIEIAAETGEVTFGLKVTDESAIGEAIEFTSLIDTPGQAFNIDFNLMFETLTGSLTFGLTNTAGDIFDVTYLAADYQNFTSVTSLISDSRFFNQTGIELRFSLFPGSASAALIKNINLSFLQNTTEVSAPSTISMLCLSILGLAFRSRNKKA